MSNKQKEDDRSSTTGSDFEPIGTPQQGQALELEEPKDNKDMDDVDGQSSCNNDGVSSCGDGEASTAIGVIVKKLLEEKEKAEMKAQMLESNAHMFEMKAEKAEKEKAEMKAEMLKSKLEMMMGMEKKEEAELRANLLAGELRAQLQAMLLKTIEEEVPKSLKRMEEDALAANLKKLVDDELLKVWLATGAGQLRCVSLLRIASNQLISFGGWAIHDGRLKATKTGSGYACVRADKPFPVSGAQNQQIGQLLYFFEVTVITKGSSWITIGLCGPNFPFTSTDTFMGNVSGSFGIDTDGAYHASGKRVNSHGKGNFTKGDVVGCGLLVLPAERRLFFTKNGEVWGKPILLGPDDAKAEDLFPAVSAFNDGHEVEYNFGADFEAKPFKYDLTQLNVLDV